MKKILLLIVVVYTSVFAYTITHDDGYDFDGHCSKGSLYGFYDKSNSYGQACAGGECVKGNYSRDKYLTKINVILSPKTI